ncbi:hypothetical protein VTN02DRAFT_2063 [Thermoascus thermophilus]
MSTPQDSNHDAVDPQIQYHEDYGALEAESYTAQRLRHASAHHLHMTSRRFFIGPIPEGWLNSHRRSWYKTRLSFKNYTSRTVPFAADPSVPHQKHLSGLTGPPIAGAQQPSFLQSDTSSSEDTESEDYGRNGSKRLDSEGASKSNQRPSRKHVAGSQAEGQSGSSGKGNTPSSNQEDPDVASANTAQASRTYYTARETIPSENGSGRISSSRTTQGNVSGNRSHNHGAGKRSSSGASHPPVSQQLSQETYGDEADPSASLPFYQQSEQSKDNDDPGGASRDLQQKDPQPDGTVEDQDYLDEGRAEQRRLTPLSSRLARFNLDDNVRDKQQRIRSRLERTQKGIASKRARRKMIQEGEIIKAEKMLVRVEETVQRLLPDDYSENDSLKIESQCVDKWREYLVVCRKSTRKHTPYTIQMHKTRVIPKVENQNLRKYPRHEVTLNYKNTRVNLYSSLDKTLVIWKPFNDSTRIYIIRPRSAAHAVEWYTFIRQSLGWRWPPSILINVPDLGVSLIFRNPFEQLERSAGSADSEREQNGVLTRTAAEEHFAASAIIKGCMEMLKDRTEWADVLSAWSKFEKMGLAWKRYDRLEWVHGPNELKMYGTIAMQMTHDLELRPKHHYSTVIKHNDDRQEEPAPIEGFLIRLTSQRGVHQRLNRMFFKRLYFSTQDHYLCFCRPAKAAPPAPPKFPFTSDENIPSSHDIVERMPLQYDINPYPVQDGNIAWLLSDNKDYVREQDEEAYAEAQRNLHNIYHSEGYIDLCRVQEVRHVHRGSSPADRNINEGPDVEFHREVTDTHRDDGTTNQFDDDRTFEMTLDNGLVVRLQAYNTETRDEWMKRLDVLVKYWKARIAADSAELKRVRQHNLEILNIDEEMESIVGQFARKWEVKKAEASPRLYNMCAICGCRPIKMSGQLYRKPRRHATFTRCNVILTAGKLLIFSSALRKRNGVEIPHIHQELSTTLDLSDCYIYSGLLTENELLYRNRAFDSSRPGRNTLPRVYLSTDGWTSSDEDTAICFVIWHPLRKSLFRAAEETEGGRTRQTLRQVSTLGAPGRSVVFKTRSRVERDRWVLSIESEIDRLQEEQGEDIRVISQ